MNSGKRIPRYLWSLISLISGLIIGAWFGDRLSFVSSGTHSALTGFIKIVPILIFIALCPAISKLKSQGGGGKLAASVIGWYLLTSTCAGLIGIVFSSLLFNIEISSGNGNMIDEAYTMFATLNGDSGASWPLFAILFAVIAGLIGTKIPALQKILNMF